MGKVRLVLDLDDTDPSDAQAIRALSGCTDAERKNLIVSGILYFTHAPAFGLTYQMQEVSAKIQELSAKLGAAVLTGAAAEPLPPTPAPAAPPPARPSAKPAKPPGPQSSDQALVDKLAEEFF